MGLLVKNQNQKLKVLVNKIKNLKNTLKLVEEELLRRLILFRQAIVDYCLKNNLPLQKNIFDDQNCESNSISNKKRKVTKFVKKLYREIATLTHPDKTTDSELNNIFIKCGAALSGGFIYDIIESAVDLDICVSEISLSELVFLHEEISELEELIAKNKKTYCWIWFENKKDIKYIKQYLSL